MGKLAKIQKGEIVNYEEAKLRYQRITTVQQALLAAQKIGIDVSEITPAAIDVVWEEIALGRFLSKMTKNKGVRLAGKKDGLSVILSDDSRIPTVVEIVGSLNKSSLLQKIAKFSDEKIEDYINVCVENKFLPKSGDLKNLNTTISKMTGDNEGYTPREYIEMARRVMGSIDLDPCSCDMAQEIVQAKVYYTEETNGLDKDWSGNVWMNPPYANKLIVEFIDKLLFSDISQAIVLTNNNTDTQWFKKLFLWSNLLCFTTGRINFYKKDGTISAPTNGQTFFYMGENTDAFIEEFNRIGLIMFRYE